MKHCKKLLRMCPKLENHPYSNCKIPCCPPELLPRFPAHPKDAFHWDFPSWLLTSVLNNTNDSIYSPSGQPQGLRMSLICVFSHISLYIATRTPGPRQECTLNSTGLKTLLMLSPSCAVPPNLSAKSLYCTVGKWAPWECFVTGVWSVVSSLAHPFSKDGPTNSQCINIHIKTKRKMSVVLCSQQNFSHISSF